MKNRIHKKSVMAIFSACVCALLFLCASAARPTKAYAETYEETYTIAAFDSGFDISGQSDYNRIRGTFYLGMEPQLLTASWKNGGDSGTITFDISEVDVDGTTADGTISNATFSDGSKWDSTTNDVGGTSLSTDHTHDFTANAGSYNWEYTDNGHYAVCSDCGFELEVTHRPDGRGVCMDCGKSVIDLSDYVNTYTFTIPGPEELDNSISEDNWEGNELTIKISVDADLRAGDTLALYLVCSGVLTSESGISEISYTMKVESDIVDSISAESPSGDDSEPIWSYQAPIPEEYNPADFETNFMTNISGTITITLTIEDAIYPDTYTDTLTFSASILEYGSEED